jgi:serine-type D-Ala-D-Ala endopeptidase (penicillin-binding protein 7)
MKWLCGVLLFICQQCLADVSARSYIVMDEAGTVILEKNADEIRPIASITKLLTARSAVAYDPNEEITITADDVKFGRMKSTPLRQGKTYTREQLIQLSLISSDNVAAIALGRTAHPPFILPQDTVVVEASGLNAENVSSARSIAILANTLINTKLAKTSVQQTVSVNNHIRYSTNPLLNKPGWIFELSKTGFINAAGGCVVVVFKAGDRLLTAVILGSRDVPTRWRDLYKLRQKVDSTFFWNPAPRVVTKSKRVTTK